MDFLTMIIVYFGLHRMRRIVIWSITRGFETAPLFHIHVAISGTLSLRQMTKKINNYFKNYILYDSP